MKHEIKLIMEETGEVLETVEIRTDPPRFIIYRGQLLERRVICKEKHCYVQRSYLELG